MKNSDLNKILHQLPLFSEEGGFSTTVSRSVLIQSLVDAGSIEDSATATILLLELQFSTLSLLDPGSLSQGEWRFLSYPASLAARSILSTMSAHGQLLEPSFWYSDAPEQIREEQRTLLHTDLNKNRLK